MIPHLAHLNPTVQLPLLSRLLLSLLDYLILLLTMVSHSRSNPPVLALNLFQSHYCLYHLPSPLSVVLFHFTLHLSYLTHPCRSALLYSILLVLGPLIPLRLLLLLPVSHPTRSLLFQLPLSLHLLPLRRLLNLLRFLLLYSHRPYPLLLPLPHPSLLLLLLLPILLLFIL